MTELTKEEKAVLEKLMRDNDAAKAVPNDQKVPVRHPAKYSFPIGFDDKDRKFGGTIPGIKKHARK